jgi:hypothetical protein
MASNVFMITPDEEIGVETDYSNGMGNNNFLG